MQTREAFAGVTGAQRVLVEYWKSLRDGAGRVAREDVNPGPLRSELACISVVEVEAGGAAVFRLVGSRLCDALGENPRGREVNDVLGPEGDKLALSVSVAIERGCPVGGVIAHDDGVHAWLRLPLVGDDGALSQVLCHDEVLASTEDVIAA